MAFEPAPHAPLPNLGPHSGVVVKSVELVTLTYDDYELQSEVEAFGDAVVASGWYQTVGDEYGVKPGRHVKKLRLGPAPASLTKSDIAAKILSLINSEDAPPPTTTDNQVLYLFYVPHTVAFKDAAGAHSYHEVGNFASGPAGSSSTIEFPIAVVLDDGSGLAATTTAAAHQLINAATDPYTAPHDGYFTDAPMNDPWSLVLREVADLCDGENTVTDLGYVLPRVYSNRAAAANGTPCMPAGPDDTWTDVYAMPSQVQRIAPGASLVFELIGWSTRDLPPWALRTQVTERSNLTEEEMAPVLSDDTISNRMEVTLTVHAPIDALPGTIGGLYVLSGPNVRPWTVGFVVQ
jgi:hypothetical protein